MISPMPRFQSRLFNWIDQSLPAQIGRSARRFLDQKFGQLAGLPLQELPRLLAYQAAKAMLYPVYLIASTAKRVFPALAGGKAETNNQLRSQPDVTGLLPESTQEAENLNHAFEQAIDRVIEKTSEQTSDLPKPEIPLLLRPLAKFLNWIDRTKIQLDQSISAIIKRPSTQITNPSLSEVETKLIANRIFAEIWQQQVEQNSIKESNGLSESVSLGKNNRLEQLRRLIEAAIAYFFGNQVGNQSSHQFENSHAQDESLLSDAELSELSGTASPDDKTLPSRPKLSQKPRSTSSIKENAPLTKTVNLDRLREIIAAAIAYFIGKRSLDGDVQDIDVNNALNNVKGNQTDSLTGEVAAKIQKNSAGNPQNANSQNANSLKNDDQWERLQKLIEAAIAYFFGQQLKKPTLEEVTDISPSEEAWLTMEDVFGDDNGPWPLPLEYESVAFTQSSNSNAIHSSGELQNFETTTSQISQDRLEESLVFEEDLLTYQQQNSDPDCDRPLKAWIEANATILGYAYNPVMTVILWIDAIVLKIEDLIIAIWKGLINFPKRLLHFIRYGK